MVTYNTKVSFQTGWVVFLIIAVLLDGNTFETHTSTNASDPGLKMLLALIFLASATTLTLGIEHSMNEKAYQ